MVPLCINLCVNSARTSPSCDKNSNATHSSCVKVCTDCVTRGNFCDSLIVGTSHRGGDFRMLSDRGGNIGTGNATGKVDVSLRTKREFGLSPANCKFCVRPRARLACDRRGRVTVGTDGNLGVRLGRCRSLLKHTDVVLKCSVATNGDRLGVCIGANTVHRFSKSARCLLGGSQRGCDFGNGN